MLIEGTAGSLSLEPDLLLKTTTASGTVAETVPCQKYGWQTERLTNEPPSIVSCNRDILQDLLGTGQAETTGADNLQTVRLVFAAY
nr:gfo/Idh/MocA family oxidoreductase [Bernardetiaceae bacterium]